VEHSFTTATVGSVAAALGSSSGEFDPMHQWSLISEPIWGRFRWRPRSVPKQCSGWAAMFGVQVLEQSLPCYAQVRCSGEW